MGPAAAKRWWAEAYYSRPWAERQADLVQDGLHLVAAQTAALQERAEQAVCEHVPKLWDKLRERMQAVSQWGRDLVATWSLSREVRKAEKDLAIQLGQPVEPQKLPRDPQELREILQDRQEAIQRAWAKRQAQTGEKSKQGKEKRGIDF